jgi:flagellar assembly factor FliW
MIDPASVSSTRTVSTPLGPRDVPAHLHLVEPLPGLPGTEYTLDALDEIGFLFALRGEDGVRLFVVSPGLVFHDYAPAIPSTVLDAVCDGAPDSVLLVVVHPGDQAAPTANLLAPIVVGPTSGRALQTVLDEDLPLRAPLA